MLTCMSEAWNLLNGSSDASYTNPNVPSPTVADKRYTAKSRGSVGIRSFVTLQ